MEKIHDINCGDNLELKDRIIGLSVFATMMGYSVNVDENYCDWYMEFRDSDQNHVVTLNWDSSPDLSHEVEDLNVLNVSEYGGSYEEVDFEGDPIDYITGLLK